MEEERTFSENCLFFLFYTSMACCLRQKKVSKRSGVDRASREAELAAYKAVLGPAPEQASASKSLYAVDDDVAAAAAAKGGGGRASAAGSVRAARTNTHSSASEPNLLSDSAELPNSRSNTGKAPRRSASIRNQVLFFFFEQNLIFFRLTKKNKK